MSTNKQICLSELQLSATANWILHIQSQSRVQKRFNPLIQMYVFIHNVFILRRRTDVNSVTNWNVPLVWEGTFDPVVIDAIYKKMDPRIAVVVFAVGK